MDSKVLATNIVKKLVREGYIAYFAGGWVRDFIMEHPSDDIDIATNAPPQVILDLFPHTILVGLSFGVVVVIYEGHQFEISTFRKDIDYLNGRKPESIELSSPEEDALRRDFTINGMFYDPLEDQIYDYVHGMEDLKKGIIRTIGDPFERFREDRLRMIRAVRFSARFEFPIDPDTQTAIQENADTLFPAVAMERIWNEFYKISKFPRFDQAMIELHRLGLLPVIFPQLQQVHLHDMQHRVQHFKDFPKETPTILYIAELFPEASENELWDICMYLKISVKEANLAKFIHQGKKLLKNEEQVNAVEWVYFYAHPHADLCLNLFSAHLPLSERPLFLQRHSKKIELLNSHIKRIIEKKPIVNASLLLSEGVKPGKLMGLLLKEAEEKAIMHNIEDTALLITQLKESSLWPK